jgi:hypothetical protein
MVKAKFVYRKLDNRFLGGGFYDPQPPLIAGPDDPITGEPTQVPDYVNYGVAEFGDADVPTDTDMFDPATGGKRPMTDAERERFLETPNEVSPLQLKAALLAAGRLQAIEEAVAQADPLTQLAWKEASVFSRTSPLLRQMSAALTIADEEVDAIFRAAGRITV